MSIGAIQPNILLVTATAPGNNGVGAIILRDLCAMYPGERLSAFIIESGTAEVRPVGGHSGLPMEAAEDSRWRMAGSRVGRLLRWPLHYLANRRQQRKLIRQARDFTKLQGVNMLWLVLDAPGPIAIGRRLARALDVPYVAMVWDDIQHNLPYFGVYRPYRAGLEREFGRTLRGALRCAVIGETMKAHYDRIYGTDAIVLRHGIAKSAIHPAGPVSPPSEPLHIGFVGSVTARSAFQAFVRALDGHDWKVAGRDVHLLLAGHRFDLWCSRPANIQYLGWRSSNECIELLAGCDINYLPQPFEAHLRPLAELSFPTKLTTYLAAGRPVLLHTPDYASLRGFHDKYRFGVWTGSLKAAEIVNAIEQLAVDETLYRVSVEEGQRALRAEFTEHSFRTAFQRFLGVELTDGTNSSDPARVHAASG